MRRLIAALSVLVAGVACASPTAVHDAGRQRVTSGDSLAPAAAPAIARTSAAARASAAKVAKLPYVFQIVLENESYQSSYVDNPNHYLGRTLQKQGTLLTQYHATGHFSLDNYISMISGQAPNNVTSVDCQQYANFVATTHPVTINSSGQAVGSGCVYPTKVQTLANQLSNHKISWHGYMEDMGNTTGREQKRCGVPTVTTGGLDDTQQATSKDQYAARHNPFVYFHSLIDSGLCKANVVPLTSLPHDLASIASTSHYNFITPNLCDDGHDSSCQGTNTAGTNVGGLVGIDTFLKHWIPIIEKSPAYKKHGIIIITSDESSPSDTAACCGEKPGPTDAKPGLGGPGGGRIGTLVLSKCVRAGYKDPTPYNHYSLLRSLENMFGFKTGGTDGKGHLGYAAAKGLKPFGKDLFHRCSEGGLP